MRFSSLKFVWLLLFVMALQACHEKQANPNTALTLETFSDMKTPSYAVSSRAIREKIDGLMKSDDDSMMADLRARSYYLNHGNFMWIDRHGADSRADILCTYLKQVGRMGLNPSRFRANQIEADLKRLRNLDFDDHNGINDVLGRLEYNLTKAYLRYVTGQRFGFVNPQYVFNRIDVMDSDSVRVTHRDLFDIPMERADRAFYAMAFRKIANDSVGCFLRSVQPKSPLYTQLQQRLATATTKAERAKILCNMERCRWRLKAYPSQFRKYVLVNIPSFRLRAIDHSDTLSMRIGCGSFQTKTPLLTSRIERMDVNPQWIIPRSIIKKDVIRHVGNRAYFESRHFFVRERKTGKKVDISRVSRSMLESNDYLVIQEGGKDNSLGRIIFRFKNSFSVFMHDTSSRDIFSRDDRGVSHGCVRVERPFLLAVYMLSEKDEETIDKIKYSMTADISSESKKGPGYNGDALAEVDTLDHSRLIGSLSVKPQVPLFITYFTLYPDNAGRLVEYADVYGYDRVIFNILKNYM